MNKFFAVFLAFFVFLFGTQSLNAADSDYKNSLLKLEVNELSDNSYDIELYTKKIYNEPVKIIKKSDTIYYFLLPETNHSITSVPPKGAIKNILVKSYPYAGQDLQNGYTKVAIITDRPVNLSTSLKTLDTSISPRLDPLRLARLDNAFERYAQRLADNDIPTPLAQFRKQTAIASNTKNQAKPTVQKKQEVIAQKPKTPITNTKSFEEYTNKQNQAQAQAKKQTKTTTQPKAKTNVIASSDTKSKSQIKVTPSLNKNQNQSVKTTSKTVQPNVTKQAKQTKPLVASKPAATQKPVMAQKPTVTAKPVVASKPVAVTKPVQQTKPVIAQKPTVTTKPVQKVQPAKQIRHIEQSKPLLASKPFQQNKTVTTNGIKTQPKEIKEVQPQKQALTIKQKEQKQAIEPKVVETKTFESKEVQNENIIAKSEKNSPVKSESLSNREKQKQEAKKYEKELVTDKPVEVEFGTTSTMVDENNADTINKKQEDTKQQEETKPATGGNSSVIYLLGSFIVLLSLYVVTKRAGAKKLAEQVLSEGNLMGQNTDIKAYFNKKAKDKSDEIEAGLEENLAQTQTVSNPVSDNPSVPMEEEEPITPQVVEKIPELTPEEAQKVQAFNAYMDSISDSISNENEVEINEKTPDDVVIKELYTPIQPQNYYNSESIYVASYENAQNSSSNAPLDETLEQNDDVATIVSSSKLTETRGLYLAKFEGETSLVGYIQDDIFVLYNFGDMDVKETDIESQLAQENETDSLYIVKTAGKKLMVKSSPYDMSLEMVM